MHIEDVSQNRLILRKYKSGFAEGASPQLICRDKFNDYVKDGFEEKKIYDC